MKVKKNKNLDQTIFKIKFLLSEIWNSGKYVREIEDKILEKHKKFEQDLIQIMEMESTTTK